MDEHKQVPEIDLVFIGTPGLFLERAKEYAIAGGIAYGFPNLLRNNQKQSESYKAIEIYDRDVNKPEHKGTQPTICRLSAHAMPKLDIRDRTHILASITYGDWPQVVVEVKAILSDLYTAGWFEEHGLRKAGLSPIHNEVGGVAPVVDDGTVPEPQQADGLSRWQPRSGADRWLIAEYFDTHKEQRGLGNFKEEWLSRRRAEKIADRDDPDNIMASIVARERKFREGESQKFT